MRSGRPKREFCTGIFRLTIRESRGRDVNATVDDITTPCEPLYVIISVIAGCRNLSNNSRDRSQYPHKTVGCNYSSMP